MALDPELRELAAKAFGALNSGDLDGFLALVTEDVEFASMIAEAEGATFRGHAGVRAWWQTILAAFADVRWELLDLLEVPEHPDRAIARFRISGTLGGVPVQQVMWQAVTSRGGKLNWWALTRTEDEARAAVGSA